MNCDKCKYTGICKFEDGARTYELSLHEWIDNHTAEEQEVFVKCNKFSLKYPNENAKHIK